MLTEAPVEMLPEIGMGPSVGGIVGVGGGGGGGEGLEKELELLLGERRLQEAADRERELSLFRSGSAPPTVEGSLAAVKNGMLLSGGGGVLSEEEELRADPAYLEYYYSNVKLNPRLPPPVLSKEDWRFAQRLQMGGVVGSGGIGDRRGVGEDGGGSNSLFSYQPEFGSLQVEGGVGGDARKMSSSSGEWVDREGDGLIGLPGLGLGTRQKSFAEILQDDLSHAAAIPCHPSRPTSRNSFNGGVETSDSDGKQFVHARHEVSSIKFGSQTIENCQNVDNIQSARQTPRTFASVLSGSLSKTSTPDPQMLKRTPSPSLPPVGTKISAKDKKASNGLGSFDGIPARVSESADMAAAFSSLSLSQNNLVGQNGKQHPRIQQEANSLNSYAFDMQGGHTHIQSPSSFQNSEPGQDLLPSVSHSADLNYREFGKMSELNQNNLSLNSDGQNYLQNTVDSPSNTYMKFSHSNSVTSPGNSPTQYQKNMGINSCLSSFGQNGVYSNSSLPQILGNQVGAGCLPPLFENAARMSAMGYPGLDSFELGSISSGLNGEGLHNLNLNSNNGLATGLQMPFIDPLYMQYLRAAEYASQIAPNYSDALFDRRYGGSAYMDALGLLKAHVGTLTSPEKQYGMPLLGKSESLNQGHFGNSGSGLAALAMYPGASMANPALSSSIGPASPIRHGEKNARFPISMRNVNRGLMGSWHPDALSNSNEGFAFTLLDEFKSNKTRSFELSEIAGHVVEFSADQYGSRFIQQKLETATTEEKNMVFEEILPQALSLMTDVFGNYVIQKFFEHGSASQIRELANQLIGHVLTLSLQMYGCRVIQKAIEMVDLDQQTKMVGELDGHVMRCVRDQNGNHVVQKCIECIPQNAIQFIISSFYGQVVTLSTHPYGCRVIQRVLEHCDDPNTQQIVMDEIFQCVCMLAQDQYGNYVVQHILEHGKPEERSSVIFKLSGQIVQMSQQKFASNVVEKCLTFGGAEERKLLVNEMLGTTDENEPLQAMMKDQFGNYVVQKVLETCDDQQRELILTRIKVHLNALKKYTYGKHIVARVEKLVAAGERRLGVPSPPSL